MPTSIKQTFTHVPVQEEVQLKAFATSVLTDLTAIRTAVTGITAKLDADTGITDTNYAALHNPAVLDLTA